MPFALRVTSNYNIMSTMGVYVTTQGMWSVITIIRKCITFYIFSASPGSVSIGTRCTGSNCSSTPSEVIAGATSAAVLFALILTAIVVVTGVA